MTDDAGHSGDAGDAGQQNQSGDSGDADQSKGASDDADRDDSGAGRTYSSDDIERILQARLRKYSDYDDLKTKASEFDKHQDAQKSELQRVQDKAAEHERRALDLEQRLQERTVETAIHDAASNAGLNPRLAVRLVDRTALEFDDDGSPKSPSLTTALDKAVKEFPEIKGPRVQGSADGGVRGNSQGPEPSSGYERLLRGYETTKT